MSAQAIPGAHAVDPTACPVPTHAGARAYALGEPMPAPSLLVSGPLIAHDRMR